MRRLVPEASSLRTGKSPDRTLVCLGFGYDRMVRRLSERNRCDIVCGRRVVLGVEEIELIHLKSSSLNEDLKIWQLS